MSTLVVVTRAEFFAYVGPRDIVLRSDPDCTVWQTRNQQMVGKTTPGYRCEGPETYMLTEEACAALGIRGTTS